MRPVIWKLAGAVVLGLAAGTVGGQSVIAGMAPPVVSSSSYPAEEELYAPSNPALTEPDQQRLAGSCADCSDYDLGYRFAAARKLRTASECMDYSWSYQRGCLAFLREG